MAAVGVYTLAVFAVHWLAAVHHPSLASASPPVPPPAAYRPSRDGRNDSATFNAYLQHVCNGTASWLPRGSATDVPVPRDVVVDLTGQVLWLDAPILIDHTVNCSGVLRIRGGTFAALPALATAPTNHSFLVEVLDHWTGLGVYFEQNVFASNHIGVRLHLTRAYRSRCLAFPVAAPRVPFPGWGWSHWGGCFVQQALIHMFECAHPAAPPAHRHGHTAILPHCH